MILFSILINLEYFLQQKTIYGIIMAPSRDAKNWEVKFSCRDKITELSPHGPVEYNLRRLNTRTQGLAFDFLFALGPSFQIHP